MKEVKQFVGVGYFDSRLVRVCLAILAVAFLRHCGSKNQSVRRRLVGAQLYCMVRVKKEI